MSWGFTAIWLALWRRTAPRSRLPQGGLVLRAHGTDAAMQALLGWNPCWKTKAVAAVMKKRSGTFIDVGANVGQTLLDFVSAPVRSTYLGFEPNIVCYLHLAKLIATNRLEGCRIIPAGLGERTGTSTLYACGEAASGATMLRELRPQLPIRASSICVFRLDDLPELFDGSGIALIKIDVEGTELEVLRGMEATLRSTRAWVICEVLHRDSAAEHEPYRQRCVQLMQLVSDLGYCAFRITQNAAATEILGLEKIAAFPDVVWVDGESETACDYLFVPVSDSQAARELLVQCPKASPS